VSRGALLVAVLLIGGAVPCEAQAPAHWRVFTSTDGLRESWVEDVTQGADGRVWVTHGAVDAHTAYDGYAFRRLPSAGSPLKLREGPSRQVWALLPGSAAGPTYRGLQLLDGDQWTAFPLEALNETRLKRWQFVPWKPDRVLVLTPAAILEFDRASRAVRVVCRAADTSLARFTELTPSADGGAAWSDAELGPQPSRWAWRAWSWDSAPPGPGAYELCCRASDATGAAQPLTADWNLGGYANNGVHRVGVVVD
jgi:hypothetical protein